MLWHLLRFIINTFIMSYFNEIFLFYVHLICSIIKCIEYGVLLMYVKNVWMYRIFMYNRPGVQKFPTNFINGSISLPSIVHEILGKKIEKGIFWYTLMYNVYVCDCISSNTISVCQFVSPSNDKTKIAIFQLNSDTGIRDCFNKQTRFRELQGSSGCIPETNLSISGAARYGNNLWRCAQDSPDFFYFIQFKLNNTIYLINSILWIWWIL